MRAGRNRSIMPLRVARGSPLTIPLVKLGTTLSAKPTLRRLDGARRLLRHGNLFGRRSLGRRGLGAAEFGEFEGHGWLEAWWLCCWGWRGVCRAKLRGQLRCEQRVSQQNSGSAFFRDCPKRKNGVTRPRQRLCERHCRSNSSLFGSVCSSGDCPSHALRFCAPSLSAMARRCGLV